MILVLVGVLFGATAASGPWMWYVIQLVREHAATEHETYQKLLVYQSATGRETAEALTRLAATGASEVVEARVEDREPDPHERVSRMVSEATIATGTAALREEYRRLGIHVSDEELRDEVTLLMAGLSPAMPGA